MQPLQAVESFSVATCFLVSRVSELKAAHWKERHYPSFALPLPWPAADLSLSLLRPLALCCD